MLLPYCAGRAGAVRAKRFRGGPRSGTMPDMGLTVTETSQVFVDDRGAGRAMRVTWHAEHRIAVLSAWNGSQCVATFRLPAGDVPAFAHTLTTGLAELAAVSTTAHRDDVAATLLSAPAATPPRARWSRRSRWAHHASRGLDALIERCTRLRDRLDRH